MRSRAAATVLAGLALSLTAAGCAFFNYPDEDFASVATRYQTGRATVTIGSERHVLDQVSPSSQLMSDLGAEVYWFNDDGWGLRLSGGMTGSFYPATVAIDRIRNAYWSAADYDGECKVTLDQVDAKRVKGTATCTGLRWTDVLRGDLSTGGYVEGQAPFDATIEFEAAAAASAT